MKVSLYNQKAEAIGEVELNPKVFEVKPKPHLLAEVVRIQQSNARQGGSHTKTRGEVKGGGRKPWKQKGTGRARAGSTRSPIWRHGGITFGPRKDRNWTLKVNKKVKKQALFMSLSDKAKNSGIVVLDKLELSQPKTKEFFVTWDIFKKQFKTFGKQQMVILDKKDETVYRATKNIPNLQVISANTLNVVDVIKANTLVITKAGLAGIEKHFLKD